MYKYLLNKIGLLNLAILLYFLLGDVNISAQNSAIEFTKQEQKWIKEHPVVYHGYDPTWKPVGFLDAGGNYAGISADYLKIISEKVGIEFKPFPDIKDWAHSIELIKKGDILFLDALAENEDRKEYLDFTDSYDAYPFVIVTRKDGDFIGSIEDLHNRKVAASREYFITGLLEEEPLNIDFHYTVDVEESLIAVATGEAECLISNLAVISHYLNYSGYENLKISAPANYPKIEFKMGVRRGNEELVSILQKGIEQVTPAERSEIVQNWVSVQYEHGVDMKKVWTVAGICAGIVLIVFLSFLYWNRKLKKQILLRRRAEAQLQNSLSTISHQKAEIEHQNQEVMASITYAKRLQDAILPPTEDLEKSLGEGFVLFMPKDVVSGDFYWMQEVGNVVYYAVADCTGHGVPGAMLSVVCSNALNRSVKEFNLSNPSKILDKTRELVIETFARSGVGVKDGMDIALCAMEKENDEVQNGTVSFAGANNPLWIIREVGIITEELKEQRSTVLGEKYGLIESKPNKQPVGLYSGMKPFEESEIIIHPGDILYTFTDGYADQFGGARGKKLKYKPFKKLLIDLNEKGVDVGDQDKSLKEFFIDWQSNYEQVDDVCIIGVKI